MQKWRKKKKLKFSFLSKFKKIFFMKLLSLLRLKFFVSSFCRNIESRGSAKSPKIRQTLNILQTFIFSAKSSREGMFIV